MAIRDYFQYNHLVFFFIFNCLLVGVTAQIEKLSLIFTLRKFIFLGWRNGLSNRLPIGGWVFRQRYPAEASWGRAVVIVWMSFSILARW